jgi:hypothetical protein
MAPKMAPGKISEVTATKQESDDADKIIAAANFNRHSTTTAMNHFMKTNPDAVTQLAEGALKELAIKHFIVMQQRAKATQKKYNTEHTIEAGKANFVDTEPMNRYQIHKALGAFKGDLFMGILPPKPCRLSGSTHEEAVEYDIPKNWSRYTHSDFQKLQNQNTSDAKPEDLKAMQELASLKSSSSAEVKPKEDEKSPEEVVALEKAALLTRMDQMRDAPDFVIRKFQDMKLEVTKIQSKANQQKR